MKSLRMLCNLCCVAIFLLCASLPCFADSSQLNFNFNGAGFVDFALASGGIRSTLPDGSDLLVDFLPGTPISVVTSGCQDPSDPSGFCDHGYTFGGGGSILIQFDGQTFTGAFLGGIGDDFMANNGLFFRSFAGTFILNGYDGVGTVRVGEGQPLVMSGSVSFTGTPTPEPGSFLLLFSGAGVLAGVIRGKMWA